MRQTPAPRSCWSAIPSSCNPSKRARPSARSTNDHGGAEIGEVRRQREDWQRDATRDLANGKTGNALEAYRSHGMVHEAQTREQARGDLIERWDRDRQASPDKSRIILTHTNDEVRALNEAARERMRAAGDLGDEVRVTVERGARNFAGGDRVMFLQNERGLGVKNGTLGTIEQVSAQSMTVQTDDDRSVRFDLKDYNKIDHGYAATIHKAQGMTVDRAHVLATPGMDAHGSYVALSRHRDGVELHYGRDDFANRDRLVRTLSRDRAKDMASDYDRADPVQGYAERRGITFRERVAEIVRKVVPEKLRDMFDGLRAPEDVPGPDGGRRPERESPERERSGTGAERRETEAPETEGGGRHGKGNAPVAHPGARAPCPRRGCDLRGAGDGRRGKSRAGERTAKGPPGLRGGAALWLARRRSRLQEEPGTGPRGGWRPGQPRHPRAPARNRTAHPSGPPRRPLRGALAESSTRPACASIRRATSPATRPRARRWATWREASNAIRNWNPSSPIASGSSASLSNQAAGSATNWPSPTASTSVEAGASEFEPSDLPPTLRHSTATSKILLRVLECLSCLVSAVVRNSQQEAARPVREPDGVIGFAPHLRRPERKGRCCASG